MRASRFSEFGNVSKSSMIWLSLAGYDMA